MVEVAVALVSMERLYWVLLGLGLDVSVPQALALLVPCALPAAAGLLPGGLGLREVLAAGLAPFIGLGPAAGFLSVAVDTLISLAGLAFLSLLLLAGGGVTRPPAAKGRNIEGAEEPVDGDLPTPEGPARTILFVSWNYPPQRGGIEEMVRQLFTHLAEDGPVQLLTAWARDRGQDPPNVSRSPLPGLIGFLCWLAWRLPRELARRHEVVLSSGALVGSVVEPLARVLRHPRAVIVYGTDITYPSRLYQAWLSLVLPSVPKFFAISRAVANEIVQRRFASSSTVELLPPGVAPDMVEEPASQDLPRSEVPVLLFVGRLIERKGLRPFIEHCLPRILDRRPVELWVVGGDASKSLAHPSGELEQVRRAVVEAELEDRVRLFGAVPDATLRAAYRSAHLLILPAISIPGDVEGFGIVFLEAALFGVPSVSTRIGGIPDAVSDGESGLLVEPGDWQAFAEAVLILIEDEAQYTRLARRARLRALEFDWRIISDRCREILEGLCK